MENERLQGKIILKGNIYCETGIKVGGSSASIGIGGIDNPVIKKPSGQPYIPGSSLKGKLRSLLEKSYFEINENNFPGGQLSAEKMETDDNAKKIFQLFGSAAENSNEQNRLLIRDASLDLDDFEEKREKNELTELDMQYTEIKTENSIDRVKGKALTPRDMERVPAGAKFNFEIVFNVFDKERDQKLLKALKKSVNLLENDYLGSSGTRGYGQVSFADMKYVFKTLGDYENGKEKEWQHIEDLGEIQIQE